MTAPVYVQPLAAVGAGDVPAAGGKGASLGELAWAGVRVPPGCALTTTAFVHAMRAADPAGSFARAVADLDPRDHDRMARVTAEIRGRILTAPLPAAVQDAVTVGYRSLSERGDGPGAGDVPVAVRSSATGEDSADASFAGLQHTALWVRGQAAVTLEVRRCWASLYSAESVAYRRRRGLPETTMAMAVVIQRMVDARCSGVLFTRSPTTGDRSVVAIEASWGLGSAVVGGEVTPDQYTASKVTGELLRRVVVSKPRRHRPDPAGGGIVDEDVPADLRDQPCLADRDVRALVRLGREVEDHYGSPQDVEWAFADEATGDPAAAGEGLFLLQSRPETVWSTRAAAPVAAPRPRAYDHVMARFGSRSGPGDSGTA